MTHYQYRMARRLYTEGYGLSWIIKHSNLTIVEIHRAIRLQYNELGQVLVIAGNGGLHANKIAQDALALGEWKEHQHD